MNLGYYEFFHIMFYFISIEGKLTQLIPIDEPFEKGLIVFAHIVDPFVLLLFDNGDISLMKVNEKTKIIEFHSRPERINVGDYLYLYNSIFLVKLL
jgi:hypothetical protein